MHQEGFTVYLPSIYASTALNFIKVFTRVDRFIIQELYVYILCLSSSKRGAVKEPVARKLYIEDILYIRSCSSRRARWRMEDSRPRVHKRDFSWRDQQSNLTAGHRHNAPLFPNICVITGGSWFISTKSETVRSSNPCQTTSLPFWPQFKRDLLLSVSWKLAGVFKTHFRSAHLLQTTEGIQQAKKLPLLVDLSSTRSSLNELHILHTSRNQCWFQHLCFTQSWGTLNMKNDLKTKNSNY